MDLTLSKNQLNRVQELGEGDLRHFKERLASPYCFYENSFFLNQIDYAMGGVTLYVDYSTTRSLLENNLKSKTIKYSSHNIRTSGEVHGILTLFSNWIEYAECFLNNQSN